MTSRTVFTLVLVALPLGCGGRSGLDLLGYAAAGPSVDAGVSSGVGDGGPSGVGVEPDPGAGADAACREVCRGTCSEGACVATLATHQEPGDGLAGLAVNDTSVFWVNASRSSTSIASVPKGGGPVSTVVTFPYAQLPDAIVSDDTAVYWVTPFLEVESVPASGGAISTLSANRMLGGKAGTVAVEGANLYVGMRAAPGQAWVAAFPVRGGAPATVTQVGLPLVVAIDDSGVYFDGNDDGIYSVPLAGAPLTTVARPERCFDDQAIAPPVIALDPTSVYWVAACHPEIKKAPKGGGTVTTLTLDDYPAVMAVGSQDVYWVWASQSENEWAIKQVPKNGGPTTKVVAGDQPRHLITDAASLYWTTHDTVMKLTPTCGCP